MHRKRNYNHQENYDNHLPKKYSKSLILLKSSVVMMFIVLITLLAAFLIIKSNKNGTKAVANNCDKAKTIKLLQNIENIEIDGEIITILTKYSNNKQQIIRLNANCGNELNRITLEIEGKNK